jgi:hypothetical protein
MQLTKTVQELHLRPQTHLHTNWLTCYRLAILLANCNLNIHREYSYWLSDNTFSYQERESRVRNHVK